MAKNNKPAEAYAQPHTMSGKGVTGELPAMSTESGADYIKNIAISVGTVSKGNYPAIKTDGITMRGHGAATKGIKSRGPMA
jgi:hypothetical protein